MSMIHDITAVAPRNKLPKRKGRGKAAGQGKTAGRGTKGSFARAGTTFKQGHEHGQTPLYRRMPKRGFSNENFENRFHVVNISQLERFDEGTTVDQAALIAEGLVPDSRLPVKILGDGRLGKKLTVVAAWFSHSAHEQIIKAGGAAQTPKGEDFAFPKVRRLFPKQEQGGKKKATPAPDAPTEAAAPVVAAAPAADIPPAAEGA